MKNWGGAPHRLCGCGRWNSGDGSLQIGTMQSATLWLGEFTARLTG
jgi:hypothetical protein